MITKITIQDDTFEVEWESSVDYLIPENQKIFDNRILDCPEEMLKKYGESLIIFKCCEAEEWYKNNSSPLPCSFKGEI